MTALSFILFLFFNRTPHILPYQFEVDGLFIHQIMKGHTFSFKFLLVLALIITNFIKQQSNLIGILQKFLRI